MDLAAKAPCVVSKLPRGPARQIDELLLPPYSEPDHPSIRKTVAVQPSAEELAQRWHRGE